MSSVIFKSIKFQPSVFKKPGFLMKLSVTNRDYSLGISG